MGIFGRVNGKVAAIGGGALAAVLAGGAIVMLSGGGGGIGASADGDPTARPDASTTAGPWVTPGEPPASPYVTVPYDPASLVYPASFDDGIDAADLPPLAERPGPSYPPAHVMQPWVWDHVGPGWGVSLVCEGGWWSPETGGPAPAKLYLLSPEGIFFDVREVSTTHGGCMLVGASIAEARASIVVHNLGMACEQTVSLQTADLLEESCEPSSEEEGGYGSAELGPFEEGYRLGVLYEPDCDFEACARRSYTIIEPGGAVEPLVLPGTHLALASDGYVPHLYSVSEVRDLLFVDTPIDRLTPIGARVEATRLDIVSQRLEQVFARLPQGYDRCGLPGPIVGGASGLVCWVGGYGDPDYAEDYYVLTWDGAVEARQFDYSFQVSLLGAAWGELGFSLGGAEGREDYVEVRDTAGHRDAVAYRVPETASPVQHPRDQVPYEFAPGRFLFATGYTIAGYDRATGETLELVGPWIRDTGAPAAWFEYLPFGQLGE